MKKDEDDESMGPVFRAMQEHDKEKRAARRDSTSEWLAKMGVPFVMHSTSHYCLTVGGWLVDYWPGTARWIVRGERRAQFSRPRLESFIKKNRPR